MTRWAEEPRLAREGNRDTFVALRALVPGDPFPRIATEEEPVDRVDDDGAQSPNPSFQILFT